MKKFVLLFQGWGDPTDRKVRDAWTDWFAEIGDSIVDGGNPFGAGREVTKEGSRELPLEPGSTTGYTIVEAENMDAAEKLLANCPIMTSVRVYEAMSM
jgi:hypothetical protein